MYITVDCWRRVLHSWQSMDTQTYIVHVQSFYENKVNGRYNQQERLSSSFAIEPAASSCSPMREVLTITQFYFPPDRSDVPTIIMVEAGTQFVNPWGVKGWFDLSRLGRISGSIILRNIQNASAGTRTRSRAKHASHWVTASPISGNNRFWRQCAHLRDNRVICIWPSDLAFNHKCSDKKSLNFFQKSPLIAREMNVTCYSRLSGNWTRLIYLVKLVCHRQKVKGSSMTFKGHRGLTGFRAQHFSVSQLLDGGNDLIFVAALSCR